VAPQKPPLLNQRHRTNPACVRTSQTLDKIIGAAISMFTLAELRDTLTRQEVSF
jgi:hypothetical protein